MFLQGMNNGLVFILGLLFDFYIFVLIIRFLLQKRYANYFNPFTQFILKITNLPLKPLQKVLPGFKGFDLAIVLLVLVLSFAEMVALFYLQYHLTPNFLGLLVAAIASMFDKVITIYFFCILVAVIMSWLPNLNRSPLSELVYAIVGPLMTLARQWLPPIGGIDLSPIPLLIVLKLFEIVLFDPMMVWGLKLALNA